MGPIVFRYNWLHPKCMLAEELHEHKPPQNIGPTTQVVPQITGETAQQVAH